MVAHSKLRGAPVGQFLLLPSGGEASSGSDRAGRTLGAVTAGGAPGSFLGLGLRMITVSEVRKLNSTSRRAAFLLHYR